jgi:hypothetical protein
MFDVAVIDAGVVGTTIASATGHCTDYHIGMSGAWMCVAGIRSTGLQLRG